MDAQNQIPLVLSTAVQLTLVAGIVGSLLIVGAALLGAGQYIKVTQIEQIEITISIFLLAIALPFQAVSATYKGVNEAYLNFKGISILRVLLGMANFGVPYLVSLHSTKIYWLVMSLVISRGMALYAYKQLADRCVSSKQSSASLNFSHAVAKALFKFGGWFTLSSVLNPAVATADRLIIASTISAAAVSVYVIPYELVVQSLVLVGAVTTVTFPYLSQLRVTSPNAVQATFYKILAGSAAMMAVITIIYMSFGSLIISKWLGPQSDNSLFTVMQVLSVGLVPYTIGTVCVSLLHARGNTALTAQINLIEFPFFLILIYILTSQHGVVGAAYAWVSRVTLDAAVMLFFAAQPDE